ncbi:hypothetical protein [Sciscionella sediminilitoris]|uniref:hypothetical protein n=1 Tax=Sciscionella sediminilitoris TaxID=1445613 RepID=UPI0012E0D3EE|nr:hypothetical protein [Sciscionella sp. SE31]
MDEIFMWLMVTNVLVIMTLPRRTHVDEYFTSRAASSAQLVPLGAEFSPVQAFLPGRPVTAPRNIRLSIGVDHIGIFSFAFFG